MNIKEKIIIQLLLNHDILSKLRRFPESNLPELYFNLGAYIRNKYLYTPSIKLEVLNIYEVDNIADASDCIVRELWEIVNGDLLWEDEL